MKLCNNVYITNNITNFCRVLSHGVLSGRRCAPKHKHIAIDVLVLLPDTATYHLLGGRLPLEREWLYCPTGTLSTLIPEI